MEASGQITPDFLASGREDTSRILHALRVPQQDRASVACSGNWLKARRSLAAFLSPSSSLLPCCASWYQLPINYLQSNACLRGPQGNPNQNTDMHAHVHLYTQHGRTHTYTHTHRRGHAATHSFVHARTRARPTQAQMLRAHTRVCPHVWHAHMPGVKRETPALSGLQCPCTQSHWAPAWAAGSTDSSPGPARAGQAASQP